MTEYQNRALDAMEVEQHLRTYLDTLVELTGGRPMTVVRVARIVLDEVQAAYYKRHPPAALVSAETILAAVAAAHNMTVKAIRNTDRTRPVAWCRHHAAWELRQRRPDLGLNKIAAWLDRKNHVTVMNSLKQFTTAVQDGRYEKERALVERALS
jgi:chromosomal replication initiation ATPase DnaA